MAYFEYYQAAWAVYLVSAVVLLIVWFQLTKNIQSGDLKQYLRLIPSVLLLTPAVNDQALAPAFIVVLGEFFTQGMQAAMMGVVPLLVALLMGAITLALYSIFKPRPKFKRPE